jgi:hypothetical protein
LPQPRDDFEADLEDITGSSGLPEDDPHFDGYVRVRDLVPATGLDLELMHLRQAFGPVALPFPLPLNEPPILSWLRVSGRIDEWRKEPICLRCGIPSRGSSFERWGERGVLCSLCELDWKREKAEVSRLLGERGWVQRMIDRLGALAKSPQGRALERLNRSMSPAKRGPKEGSHRDDGLPGRVQELERKDALTHRQRPLSVKAPLAGTTEKTYRKVRDASNRKK